MTTETEREAIVREKSARPKRPRFFVVFSPTGEAPAKLVHPSHKAAFREAHRMAGIFKGSKFFVMESASKPIVQSEVAPPISRVSE